MFSRLKITGERKTRSSCKGSGNMVGKRTERQRGDRNLNSNCIMKKFNYDLSEQVVKFTFIMLGTL